MREETGAGGSANFGRVMRGGATRWTSYFVALVVSLGMGTRASAQNDVYRNTTTYLSNGVAHGGTADVGSPNLKTLMVADDILVAPGGAGLPINGYTYSVQNFNGVAVSARALITVYADNGANAPGDLLYSVTFAPQTYSANTVQTFTFSPGTNIFNVPASGKMWAGLAFDNRLGMLSTTQAQLDLLGQGAYGPGTLGSSSNSIFTTNAAGDYAVNNPVGHLENTGFSLGWRFSSPSPLPEPGGLAVGGLAIATMMSRRRR